MADAAWSPCRRAVRPERGRCRTAARGRGAARVRSRRGAVIRRIDVHRKELLMPNSVRFHRVLRATPGRVYRAFLDPDAMVKWLPPNGFTGKVHHLDAKVGGTYRMSFTNF